MLGHQSFSYSGLKSSVSRAIASLGGAEQMSMPQKRALAHEFQRAAFAQLEDKLVRAVVTGPVGRDSRLARGWRLFDSDAQTAERIDSVVCSGGVASNQFLRDRYADFADEMPLTGQTPHRAERMRTRGRKVVLSPVCTECGYLRTDGQARTVHGQRGDDRLGRPPGLGCPHGRPDAACDTQVASGLRPTPICRRTAGSSTPLGVAFHIRVPCKKVAPILGAACVALLVGHLAAFVAGAHRPRA